MSNKFKQETISVAEPGFFRLWGRRLLVHFTALLLMSWMSSESLVNAKIPDGFSVGIYLGVICLLHRGVWHEKRWFVPSLAGLAQTLLLCFLGMPLYASIFWGGVQCWLQRVIRNWEQMGSEWIVLPFLIMVASNYFTNAQFPFPLWPLYTLVFLAIAGYIANKVYQRIQRETIFKDMLTNALRRLQYYSESKKLAEDIHKQISMILVQTMSIEQANLQSTDRGRSLITELDVASKDLEKKMKMPPITRGGWSNELFSSKAWNKLTGKQNIPSLAQTLRNCNLQIMEILRSGNLDSSNDATSMDSLSIFEQQARQLIFKAEQCPKKITNEVGAIALLTFEIVKNMREDPRDRPAGERFLQRYLSATEHITDEYCRLVSSKNTREDVTSAIRRAEEVLSRLHKAFSEELATMLTNDSASFTAELNALDKLLKMGGH